MNSKRLSPHALSVIDQYMHFRLNNAVTSVPYYNNRVTRSRAALRVNVGKGSPKEIFDELETVALQSHINKANLSDEGLKMLLTDSNFGIDCSGLAYYILNAESRERGYGQLDKHMKFPFSTGIVGKIRSSLRPIENCGVSTFAHESNSHSVEMKGILPGDMITMLGGPDSNDRDHILVIHEVEYQNFIPTTLHYVHTVAYPEDGIYATGIRMGTIDILNPQKPIIEARWVEAAKEGSANILWNRAVKSKTEVRRLNWFT